MVFNSLVFQWFVIEFGDGTYNIPLTMSNNNYRIYGSLEGTNGAYKSCSTPTFSKKTISSFYQAKQTLGGGSGSATGWNILIIGI